MKKKLKNSLNIILAMLLLVSLLGTVALADEVDPSKGKLTVMLPAAAEEELKEQNIPVNLYRIASVEIGTQLQFTAIAPFEKLDVSDVSTEDKLKEIANKAVEILKEQTDLAPVASIVLQKDGDKVLNTAGSLEEGLYLIETPDVETDLYVYEFTPFIVSVPYPEEDGYLNHILTATLKYERRFRDSKIVITKDLTNWRDVNTDHKTPVNTVFVFKVTAVFKEVTVYSDVLTLNFQGPGTKSLVVDGLPVGAQVTVEEVYSGGEYTLIAGDKIQTLEVKAPAEGDGPEATDWCTRFRFGNKYSDKLIVTGGVVNAFEKAGDTWTWHPIDGNSGTVHAKDPEAPENNGQNP